MSRGDVPSLELYPEAMALAITTIVYTTGSAAAAGFTHILFRLNGKQVVYVSLLSLSIFLQQLFTMAHGIVNIVFWPALQMEEYAAYLEQWRNPNATIVFETSANVVVRVIFAFRTYFFNVESLLFFFWSLMLFVSVWEIQSRVLKSDRFITGSKWISFLLPAVQVILSNLPQVRKTTVLRLILCNCTVGTTCTLGTIFLLLILVRCIYVMWSASWAYKVQQWRPYDHSRHSPPPPKPRLKTAHSATSSASTTASDSEDRYILLRFVAGFLTIGGLQAAFLLAQYFYAKDVMKRMSPLAERPHPGWTAKQQLVDWAYFLASGSTGYLILIVFGATRESRRQMRRIAANIRTFLCGHRARDEEYVSFRAHSESIRGGGGGGGLADGCGGRRRGGDSDSDSDGDSSNGGDGEGMGRALPPKPMTPASPRNTPLGSPSKSAVQESPAGFSVVDLRTPVRSTHRGKGV
ncbi:hypothetical protein HOY80DRAFT_1076323 [Tuber brumale]|nr:hypothetical protein HOY80DRAFT_1076323 [Tuber brumale]